MKVGTRTIIAGGIYVAALPGLLLAQTPPENKDKFPMYTGVETGRPGSASELQGQREIKQSAPDNLTGAIGRNPTPGVLPPLNPPGRARLDDGLPSDIDSAAVVELQRRLKAAMPQEYRRLPINGRFTADTRDAILSYQRRNALRPTGVLDAETLQRLGLADRFVPEQVQTPGDE